MKKQATRAFLATLALSAVLAAACGTSASSPSATAGPATLEGKGGAAPAIAYGPAVPAPADAQRSTVAGQPPANQPAIPIAQAFDPDRALILTASVSMRAKDAWTVADRVQQIAFGLGGDVLSLAQSGTGDQHSATLSIRVPQARFNDALRQIREVTDVDVVSSSVEGKDVTDQFVDLQARLKAKQDEEQRYLALLVRADKIDDILKIDAQLSNVRTQIEQLTGQVNSIKARTTFSTITVQVSPVLPGPIPTPDPKAYDPSKTLERAVASLASLMRIGLDVAIWGLVFGWIPLMVLGLALLVSRGRTRIVPMA